MNINNTYSVLVPAASGADVVSSGFNLAITGCPTMDIRQILTPVYSWRVPPIQEKTAKITVTVPSTPTAALRDAFLMRQIFRQISTTLLPGLPNTPVIDSLSGTVNTTVQTGQTNAQVATALESSLIGYKDPSIGFQFTETTTSNVITITASAGFPILEITDQSAPANALTIANANTTLTAVTSDGATPDILTKTAHGLTDGQVITVSGMLTDTVANGTWQVAYLSSSTFSLRNIATGAKLAGSGSAGTAGVVLPVPTESRGAYNDLLFAGVLASQITTTHIYGTIEFNFMEITQGGVLPSNHLKSHTLYVDAGTSYTTLSTNYTNFISALATALGTQLYIS